MSRLIEKLRTAVRGEQGRLGFGTGGAKRRAPGIGLVASVAGDSGVARAAAEVADALLFAGESDVSGARELAGKAIWGLDLSAGRSMPDVARINELETDFIVFAADADVRVFRAEQATKVLKLSTSAPDAVLQALGTLPIEIIMLDETLPDRLTVASSLDFMRIGALSHRPLVVPIGAGFPLDQLVALRDIGVAGISVIVRSEDDIAVLRSMRETIAQFPQPPKRDRSRDALIPTVTPPAPAAEAPAEPDQE